MPSHSRCFFITTSPKNIEQAPFTAAGASSCFWYLKGWAGCCNLELLWCKLLLDPYLPPWWSLGQHSLQWLCLYCNGVFMERGQVHSLDSNWVIGTSSRPCGKKAECALALAVIIEVLWSIEELVNTPVRHTVWTWAWSSSGSCPLALLGTRRRRLPLHFLVCSIDHCLIVWEHHLGWSSNHNTSLCVTACCFFQPFLWKTPA